MENQDIVAAGPIELVNGTVAESYEELLIDEIIINAAYDRLANIGSRLHTINVSVINRSTVNNIRLEVMRNRYIASLIANTPEFEDDSPDGLNKRAEHAELHKKSLIAETIVYRAAPETMPRQYSYEELIANRAAIARRIGIIANRITEVYIEHTSTTLNLIKVREKMRSVDQN